MRKLSHAYILSIWLVLLIVPLCNAQQKIRTVEKYPYSDSPIEVVSRELGNKPFIDDTRVLGDQDWLKQLTLDIKNVSNKNIISFDISLYIKKEGKMLTGVGFPILFRARTKTTVDNVRTPQGEEKQGVLQPGEVVKVRVSDEHMSKFGAMLRQYDAEDIDHVKIEIQRVYFDDGTHWGFGQYVTPKQSFSQRFMDWMKYFLPTDASRSASQPLALIFPAGSRFFFAHAKATIASPTTDGCVWFVESELTAHQYQCYGANDHGCTLSDSLCVNWNFDDTVHPTQEAGLG